MCPFSPPVPISSDSVPSFLLLHRLLPPASILSFSPFWQARREDPTKLPAAQTWPNHPLPFRSSYRRSLAPGSAPASSSPLSSSSRRGRVRCLVSPWKLTDFFSRLLLGLGGRIGGTGRVGSSDGSTPPVGPALPTVGIETGPGPGMGIDGLRGMSPPPSGGMSAACRSGSAKMSSGIPGTVGVRGSNGGLCVGKREAGRRKLLGDGFVG